MVFGPWYSTHAIKVVNISKVYITHITSTDLYILGNISKVYISHITSTHLYILGPTYQNFTLHTLHTLHLHIPIFWAVECLSAQLFYAKYE